MQASRTTAFVLGAATLVGGILAGKFAIDHTLNRPSWQATQRRSGGAQSIDDSLRFVATITGLTFMLIRLPETWEDAKHLGEQIEEVTL